MRQRHLGGQGHVEFLIPPELECTGRFAAIGQQFSVIRESDKTLSRRFYDSFDWRLFNADVSLEWRFDESPTPVQSRSSPLQAAPAQPMLRWHKLSAADAEPLQQPLESEPGLLDEMPAGPVRDQLARLLEMRRLLPLVDVISQQTPLRLLNEDEKTVVRLVIEQNRFREPHAGGHGLLICRLRLQPVRGYPDDFDHARRVIEEHLGCRAVTQPLALEALLAAGHQPGAYSTKLDEQLAPDQRADLATKQILRGLLGTLEANIEGARRNLDSEFLHDLRVATRRTRSALGQIKQVFPEDIVADFKQRFAWLQQVTGPVRDLDVYLLDFPQMERRLPPVLRKELRPLHEQLLRQHAEAQRQLASELGSGPFRELLQDWRSFLDADVPAAEASVGGFDAKPLPLARKAELPIKQVADQRIRRMLKRVCTEGRAITEQSPPEELHELRKSCKKLRYLMEFFQSLYPKERIREQIKQTKLLLDNLGRFQDTAVQAQHLREHAESSAGENGLPPATLLAMGALIYLLLDDQLRARAAFGEVFARFDSAENAERFRALLAAPARQQPKDGRNPGSISGDASSEASTQSGTRSGTRSGSGPDAELEPHPAPTGAAHVALSPRR